MDTFGEAFKHVIGIEAGYVNDPKDPGGETKYGISKRAYPNEDIKNLTLDRVKAIYKRDYWDKCRCGEMPTPLDLYVFDAAVNQGCKPAIMMLQEMLGVATDGIIGPKTLQAAGRVGDEQAALYMAYRALRYIDTKNFSYFGKGWLKRLFIVARG